jgi:hypothetical protein
MEDSLTVRAGLKMDLDLAAFWRVEITVEIVADVAIDFIARHGTHP